MTNKIAKNSVVTLKYTVRDPDGNLIDDGEHPLVYLHGGYDGIFTAIEEALHDRKKGDKLQVKLQPEEAFGEYDEDQVLVEDLSLFPPEIEVGMFFERVTDNGEDEQTFRVTDIAEDKVVIDGNHPLAGTALIFDIEIGDVRPATKEEISHGHVHGTGEHHH